MGGLIAADALLKLSKPNSSPSTEDVKEDVIDNKRGTGHRTWIGNWWENKPEGPIETLETIDVNIHISDTAWKGKSIGPRIQNFTHKPNAHLNITALICFDSPFFGVNPSVFTVAAGTKASEMINSYIPPESLPRKLIGQVGEGIQTAPGAISSGVQFGASAVSSGVIIAASAITSGVQAGASAVSGVASTAYQSFSSTSSISNIVVSTPSILASAPSLLYNSLPNMPSYFSKTSSNYKSAIRSESNDCSKENLSNNLLFQDKPAENIVLKEILDNHIVQTKSQAAFQSSNEDTASREYIHSYNAASRYNGVFNSNSQNEREETKEKMMNNELLDDDEQQRLAYLPELLPTSKSSNYFSLVTLGLIGAGVAGSAYYTGGLAAICSMTIARQIAVAYVLSHADSARQHLQFLYPIWGESEAESQQRIDKLMNFSNYGEFTFKCFFIEVSKSSLTSTA